LDLQGFWLSSFWSFGFFFQVLRFQLAWRGFKRLWLASMMFGLAFGDMSTCFEGLWWGFNKQPNKFIEVKLALNPNCKWSCLWSWF
jgi:hypothetical protein